jgi:hypothetical protein
MIGKFGFSVKKKEKKKKKKRRNSGPQRPV